MDFSAVRMKSENGFHVDVCTADSDRLERDMTIIRMNVDNFDEVAKLLVSKGFRECKAVGQNTTSSSRYAYYVSRLGS